MLEKLKVGDIVTYQGLTWEVLAASAVTVKLKHRLGIGEKYRVYVVKEG